MLFSIHILCIIIISESEMASSVHMRKLPCFFRLNSPNPNHHNYVNVFEDTTLGNPSEEEQPQQQQQQQQQQQSVSPREEAETLRENASDESGYQQLEGESNPDVVYEELNSQSSSEELGHFNRQSAVRRSIRSDAGRNIHFTRQESTRISIRSESGILEAGSGRGSRFSRQRSENMSTRSERGVRRIQTQNMDPFSNFQSSDGFENSELEGMQPLSIHQIPVPSHQRVRPTASPLGDVPGFKDPEIMGADSDSLEQLKINLPPDIYSSQILSTVKSPEQAGEDDREPGNGDEMDSDGEESYSGAGGQGGGGGRRGMVITQRKQSTQSHDILISLHPGGN